MAEKGAFGSAPKRTARASAGAAGDGTRARTPARGGATSVRRRGEAAGSELVETLNSLVDQLIKENRRLTRQLDKLSQGGGGAASATLERGLKNLQKRVEKALTGVAPGARSRTRATPKTAPSTRRKPPRSL